MILLMVILKLLLVNMNAVLTIWVRIMDTLILVHIIAAVTIWVRIMELIHIIVVHILEDRIMDH